jgi:hypothetical protein
VVLHETATFCDFSKVWKFCENFFDLEIKKMQFSVFNFAQGNVNLLYSHINYCFSSLDIHACFASTLHNIILTVLKYVDVMKQLKMKNV